MLRELVQYRHFLKLLVQRDLKMRYAGSLLGSFWNLINPLILVAIYIIVIGQIVVHRPSNAASKGPEITIAEYAVHLCAGIIPWLMFSEILTRCSTVLLENANFLRKLAFPAVILPISIFINALILHGVSAIFLMTLLYVLGAPLGPMAPLYFPIMVGMGMTALGLGMIIAVINVYFRDFGQVLQIVLQLLFWMLPIVYYRERMPDWIIAMIDVNPLSYPIRAAQGVLEALPLQSETMPGVDDMAHMLILPIAAILIGYRFFESQRRQVLDEL